MFEIFHYNSGLIAWIEEARKQEREGGQKEREEEEMSSSVKLLPAMCFSVK